MANAKDKLRELLANKALMTGAEWQRRAEETARRRAAGEFEIDKIVPGRLVSDGESGFYLVHTDFPLDARQGNVPLGAVLETVPEHIAFSACDPDLEFFDPRSAIFIDTETSGLAGGTGTIAFLVGVGYFAENCFRLEQCFMRDFDDEPPMLAYLEGLFRGRQTVISYNGKSFDIPLLRTRFIQNRMRFPLDEALQFDLLHAARRFWKLRLQDCTLPNVEQAVLDLHRHGDVPSEEIPRIWLDYLRTRDATEMDRVFYHHQMDILSLVALTALMSRSISAAKAEGLEYPQDHLSLLRLYFRQRQYHEVVSQGRRLLENEAEGPIRRECLGLMGFACKRLHDRPAMEEIWNLLLQEFPYDLVVRHELAKHHEHRTRDLLEAQRICRETVRFLEIRADLERSSLADDASLKAFRRRLHRIERKLRRSGSSRFEDGD